MEHPQGGLPAAVYPQTRPDSRALLALGHLAYTDRPGILRSRTWDPRAASNSFATSRHRHRHGPTDNGIRVDNELQRRKGIGVRPWDDRRLHVRFEECEDVQVNKD